MAAKWVDALAASLPESILEELSSGLRQGELLALPTETVYGIAARLDLPEAMAKLKKVKGRAEEHVFTVHLPDADSLQAIVPQVSPLTQKLVRRYWPGPLTLVLPDGRGGTVGVRVPARDLTREILRRVGFPIVMSSANRTGEKPAVTAQEVREFFPEGLMAIVDGGSCELAESSTVLRFDSERMEILREGIITLEDIQKTLGKTVLFLCTGNTCRSPMAVGLMKQALAKKYSIALKQLEHFGFRVLSAGLSAGSGSPASRHAVTAMKELGADISKHRSSPAYPETLDRAEIILVMGYGHLEAAREQFPEHATKIQLLDRRGEEIRDPFGGELADYKRCRDQMKASIDALVQEF